LIKYANNISHLPKGANNKAQTGNQAGPFAVGIGVDIGCPVDPNFSSAEKKP